MSRFKFSLCALLFSGLCAMQSAAAQVTPVLDAPRASEAAKALQAQVNAKQYHAVYERLSSDVKASISEQKFAAFMVEVRQHLGGFKQSIFFNQKRMNADTLRLSFMSEFERGVTVEMYFLKEVSGGQYSLYRYEVTDPSKFAF